MRAVRHEPELVTTGDARGVAGDGGGEDERGVARVVDRDLEQCRLRLVEELGDVDAGEARRYEPEGGQGGIPPADGRVGVEDAVAGLTR